MINASGTSSPNKKSKIIIIICAILTVISLGFSLFYLFPISDIDDTVEKTFELTDYSVEITVNENAVLEVKENMTAVFYSTIKRGIVRGIPLTNTYSYKEKGVTKSVTQSIEVYDLRGNGINYEYDGDWILINFGSVSDYLTPDQPYVFYTTYKVNLGKDTPKTYDMFYYNILGIDWTCNIKNFDFKVTMPKSFDTTKLNLFTGGYKSQSKVKAENYTVTNNETVIIEGSLTNIKPHNAVTLSVGLDEGYFVGAKPVEYGLSKVVLVLACISAVLAVVAFLFKKKRPTLVIPVEFYAPDDMNPADVASILKGKVEVEDTTSLIVWFASKRYLKIQVNDNEDIILTKLKEYPVKAKKIYEKMLFDKLFENGDTINLSKVENNSKTVQFIDKNGNAKSTTSDSLPMTISKVTTKANMEKPVKNRLQKRNVVFTMICMIAVAITTILFFEVPTIYQVMGSFTFPLIVSVASLGLLFAYTYFVFFLKHTIVGKTRVLSVVGLLVSIVTAFLNTALPLNNISYTFGYINYAIAIVAVLGVVVAGSILSFTEEQAKYYGRVIGFRNFILNCEKDKMDLLLKDNPEYFYDILPYAYIFGITDEFIERFEFLGYQIPTIDSYYLGNVTSFIVINRALLRATNHVSTKTHSAIADSRRSSTRGGGHFGGGHFGGGGGGFSGGGFGGGGGRSR